MQSLIERAEKSSLCRCFIDIAALPLHHLSLRLFDGHLLLAQGKEFDPFGGLLIIIIIII